DWLFAGYLCQFHINLIGVLSVVLCGEMSVLYSDCTAQLSHCAFGVPAVRLQVRHDRPDGHTARWHVRPPTRVRIRVVDRHRVRTRRSLRLLILYRHGRVLLRLTAMAVRPPPISVYSSTRQDRLDRLEANACGGSATQRPHLPRILCPG